MTNKRHPNLLSKENTAVLLVDYQEKFAPHLPENEKMIKNIKFFLSGVKIYNLPIFVSEQVPDKLGPTISEFKQFIDEKYFFTKKSMSCCGNNIFVDKLKSLKINTVAVCGIESHICVLQTCLDLINNGFKVHLITDAITSRVVYNVDIAVEKIKSAGGIISSIETALFEVAYEAGTEEFKKLQDLYKTPLAIGK